QRIQENVRLIVSESRRITDDCHIRIIESRGIQDSDFHVARKCPAAFRKPVAETPIEIADDHVVGEAGAGHRINHPVVVLALRFRGALQPQVLLRADAIFGDGRHPQYFTWYKSALMRKFIAAVFLLAACVKAPRETSTTATARPAGPVRIGFSMDTLKEERWQRDKQLVEQRAKEVGAVLDVQVANGDDAVQTKQADNMLTKGVDVLLVAPHNGEIAASIVEAAHRKGVPVIAYDRLIRNSDVDLYISHQVERMGEMQAEYALQHVPKGNYVLIGGSPTAHNGILPPGGQMKLLKPPGDTGGVKIISEQFAREWKAEEALRITEDALTRTGKKIDAVVASN